MAYITQHFALCRTGRQISNFVLQPTRPFSVSPLSCKKKKKPAVEVGGQRIDSAYQSIAARGFLRSCDPYIPPEDVTTTIQQLAARPQYGNLSKGFPTLETKFKFLEECRKIFNHTVANSYLHELQTIDDIIEFYQTPVRTTQPMDTLKQEDLPVNLHVQSNYVRYHPEEDTMFGGVSAFPKSSTLVTGLKYRKKYRGHIAKTSWP